MINSLLKVVWAALDPVLDFLFDHVWNRVVDWVLDRVRAICEAVAARIASYQARAQHASTDAADLLWSWLVDRLAEAVAEIRARLIERRETLNADDALSIFETALDKVAPVQ